MFDIDLEWPVASRYVARAVRSPKGDRAIYVAENATITLRRPLDENPSLYAEFVNLDGSESSCLAFAHKYGMLVVDNPALDAGVLESLSQWKGYIQYVREIVEFCKIGHARPAAAYRQFGKQEKSLYGGLSAYLSIVGPKSPPVLSVRCTYLIAAIELQAIQSILGGRRSVRCIQCSRLFEIGAGARRSQSKFCSTRCKDAYHNSLKAEAKRS